MAEKARNLALVFGDGAGDDAAPEGGPSGDTDITELAEGEGDEGDEPEAPPADFAVHAAEAFPELAGDDARLDAFYRTIKACHPGV